MAQIAFLLLCHRDPDAVVAQVRTLTAAGDAVAVHFDARAPEAERARVAAALAGEARAVLEPRPVRGGWGEWSLVEATLRTAATALAAFPEARHLYLVSGDCAPIRPAEEVHARLAAEDADWIESVDFFHGGWIRTGMKEERLIYRHWLNERRRKRLFYAALAMQRGLGLRRAVPPGLSMMIGSQWWCLRRDTVQAVLDFARARPDVVRFFRTTWIPDEIFFQTLVRHLVPGERIRSRPPTFLTFTDYGMPATFHDDHFDFLRRQDAFLARKIAPEAARLKARLAEVWREGARVEADGTGVARHRFVTGAGREGLRSAPRAWEAEIGAGRTLLVVVAKKWHLGQRLAGRIAAEAGLRACGYLFDELTGDLPDLGGIEGSLGKRQRDRRAVVRLVMAGWETDRLAICADPAGAPALLAACRGDPGAVRVLEIAARPSDGWFAGHARRIGLAGPATPDAEIDGLLPPLRRSLEAESAALAEAAGPALARLSEDDDAAARTAALERFLGDAAPPGAAARIASAPDLFDD